jgi:hypothetical protein
LGFKVEGFEFRVQGLGFKLLSPTLRSIFILMIFSGCDSAKSSMDVPLGLRVKG